MKPLLSAVLLSLFTGMARGAETDTREAVLVDRARQASMALGKALKGRLMSELQNGSVTGAVAVCQQEAPMIASAVSEELGVEVSRTSLKTRNPENKPDPWEVEGLHALEAEFTNEGSPTQTEIYSWVETANGEKEFRYLKAIVTDPLCLTCHGPEITPEITQAIEKRYPEDTAIGYAPNQLRGAFSVRMRE